MRSSSRGSGACGRPGIGHAVRCRQGVRGGPGSQVPFDGPADLRVFPRVLGVAGADESLQLREFLPVLDHLAYDKKPPSVL